MTESLKVGIFSRAPQAERQWRGRDWSRLPIDSVCTLIIAPQKRRRAATAARRFEVEDLASIWVFRTRAASRLKTRRLPIGASMRQSGGASVTDLVYTLLAERNSRWSSEHPTPEVSGLNGFNQNRKISGTHQEAASPKGPGQCAPAYWNLQWRSTSSTGGPRQIAHPSAPGRLISAGIKSNFLAPEFLPRQVPPVASWRIQPFPPASTAAILALAFRSPQGLCQQAIRC